MCTLWIRQHQYEKQPQQILIWDKASYSLTPVVTANDLINKAHKNCTSVAKSLTLPQTTVYFSVTNKI